jgi:hypothetical protein
MATQQAPIGSGFGAATAAAELIRGLHLEGKTVIVRTSSVEPTSAGPATVNRRPPTSCSRVELDRRLRQGEHPSLCRSSRRDRVHRPGEVHFAGRAARKRSARRQGRCLLRERRRRCDFAEGHESHDHQRPEGPHPTRSTLMPLIASGSSAKSLLEREVPREGPGPQRSRPQVRARGHRDRDARPSRSARRGPSLGALSHGPDGRQPPHLSDTVGAGS